MNKENVIEVGLGNILLDESGYGMIVTDIHKDYGTLKEGSNERD